MTTKVELLEYKRFAKEGCKENKIKMNIKDMVILETGTGDGSLHFVGNKELYISYVMFEDVKTGKTYQVYYGARFYNNETKSLYHVEEYV